MVENSLSISVFCICAAVLAVLLRQYCREQSMMIALGVCSAVIAGFMLFIEPVIAEVQEIFVGAGIPDSYMSIIFKAAAICFITQITCEICADSGEGAIASAAELWGRGALVFMSLPIIRSLLEKINEMI